MGDIPLYLSNVSVSIGQTVEVEQVGEQPLTAVCLLLSVRLALLGVSEDVAQLPVGSSLPCHCNVGAVYLPRCTCCLSRHNTPLLL